MRYARNASEADGYVGARATRPPRTGSCQGDFRHDATYRLAGRAGAGGTPALRSMVSLIIRGRRRRLPNQAGQPH